MLRSNTAGSLRPLTRARCLGQTELPQTVQGVTDAFTVPHAVKRAVFFFCQQYARGVPFARCYTLAEATSGCS